ncbi:MAG: hypothetical protein F6K30_11530 [Cyanothece sp. SIO2G6]|nr:hypothetical protein [Cyanothece sp. SIO2G6]
MYLSYVTPPSHLAYPTETTLSLGESPYFVVTVVAENKLPDVSSLHCFFIYV